ncbi:TolC family protein [Fulvivirga sp. M361]|uniref:TolC family protein n=1 Tax=Fulvivirga sp. M361 TaxID=2594266 RepID=UPI00117ADD5B|nr:TolC family protein [Fulvivirga sp. M361]TRX49191.1 TolC family protein [Fulvivirga sp. M361]
MKTRIRLLITGLMLLHASVYAQQGAKTAFSLEEAINYALEYNQNVINASYEKDIAETQVKETLSSGLPQITGEVTLNHNFEPQKQLLDASTFDPTVPEGNEVPITFQRRYDGNMALNVRQLIFDGSFFVGLQAARTFRELSSKDHIKTQIDVVEAVSKAYYNVLVTKEQYDLLEVNFSRLDTLLRETKARFETGFVEKIDVSRIQVEYNNTKVRLTNTRELLKVSYDLLKFQMGMPIKTTITLTDVLEEVLFDEEDNETFNYNERIEYSRLQTNLALTNLDIKNNRVQYLPNLYANLNLGYNTQADQANQWFEGNRWLDFGFVGATLSVPIFDGFLKKSKIQRNKIQLKQLDQSFAQLENSIDLEIIQSKTNLKNALDNMAAQKENTDLAEEIYNITRIKYQEGVGANLEVIEADADYKEAQTNYYNSLYDALVAKIDLDKAYGRLLK